MRTIVLLTPAQQFYLGVYWPNPGGLDGYGPEGAWVEEVSGIIVAYGIQQAASGRDCQPIPLTQADLLALALNPEAVPEALRLVATKRPGYGAPYLQVVAL